MNAHVVNAADRQAWREALADKAFEIEPLICDLARFAHVTAKMMDAVRSELKACALYAPGAAEPLNQMEDDIEALFAFVHEVADQARALRRAYCAEPAA